MTTTERTASISRERNYDARLERQLEAEIEMVETERDVSRAWSKAWKMAARHFHALNHKTANLLFMENLESRSALELLVLMAAFANDQGPDESLADCAFRVVSERDAMRKEVETERLVSLGLAQQLEPEIEKLEAERDALVKHLDDAYKWEHKLALERDASRAWAKAWKRGARHFHALNHKAANLLFKENPQGRSALELLTLMAAFANDQGPYEDLADCAFRVVKERDTLREGEAYERNRADTLIEENAGFVEEAEKYARLVARIIKALGKEWLEESDEDGQVIALEAIAELRNQRDALRDAAEMAREVLSHMDIQFAWEDGKGEDGHMCCYRCGASISGGHEEDCIMLKSLAAIDAALGVKP